MRRLMAQRRKAQPWFAVLAIAIVALGAGPADESTGPDWPQLLGPNRNGVSAETGLLDRWPESGLKEVWRVPGGVGMSALAIVGDRLLTLVQRDGRQWLVAHDANTGTPIWQCDLAPEYQNGMGDGPRAAPAVAGDQVFAFTGEGILAAIGLDDGKQLWSHDLVTEHNGEPAAYGMACSPLVVGDNVVVTIGAPDATVVALEARTGRLAWKGGNDPAGYSSPAVLKLGGQNQIVAATGGSLLGLAPASGTVLWRYPFETNYECNIATPILIGDHVFFSAGEDHGSVLLAVKRQGKRLEVDEVWSSFGSKSVLRSEWQTPLLLDGFLYGMDNLGGAGPITHLTCIEAATGKRAWQKPRFGKGNLIAADGKLFISTMEGELVVVRATPDKYDEVGRQTVIGVTRQAPALLNGLLYLRDDAEIVCLDVRRP